MELKDSMNWKFSAAPLAIAALAITLAGCGGGTKSTSVITDPTSTRVYFNAVTSPGPGFYSMASDGTGGKKLTDGSKSENSLTVSPDGKRLVYATGVTTALPYYSNSDGSSATPWAASTLFAKASEPSYAPGGTKVVFVGDANLFTASQDGSVPARITNFGTGNINTPSYSPDSKKIVFTRVDPDGSLFVCTINPDGIGALTLTPASSKNFRPHFSPDGKKIVFVSNRDGKNQIYTMNADGSVQTRLTNDTSNDTDPVFSPDGMKIAFYSDRDLVGTYKVYTMNADGSSQTKLSDIAGDSVTLDWR